MRFRLLLLTFVMLFCCGASKRGVLITWQKNSESDLAGYKVYQGMSSGSYDSVFVVFQNSFYHRLTVDSAEYFYAVTAFDTAMNESGYSSEVSALNVEAMIDSIPPANPNGVLARIIKEK